MLRSSEPNAIFRRIRFAPTRTGLARLEINYKVASEDPLYGRKPAQVTANWAAPSHGRPESSLTGVSYDCFPAKADLRVSRPSSWVFAGTRVKRGTRLTDLVGIESDRVNLANPTPRPMEVLAHTPLSCGGRPTTSDAVYYTTRSGAGVFAAGTMNWACAVGNRCWHSGHEESSEVVRRVTANILRVFARGPAGREHPAHDNVDHLFR